MSKRLLKIQDIYLSIAELTALTRISYLVLKKKLEKLTPAEGPMNSLLYPLKGVVDTLYLQGEDSPLTLKILREKEETRLAKARADKIEIENGLLEKKLVHFGDAQKMFGDLVISYRSRMLAIPTKAAFMIQSMTTPQQVEGYLRDEIHGALNELSRDSQEPATDEF